MKEQMNVHKALSELKILDNRIKSKIDSIVFCVSNKHSNTKIDGKSIEEFKEKIKADYMSVMDLIKRRNAIKRAVGLSNAVTKVVIIGKEYTVAEALEMNNHGIELKEHLYNVISYHLRGCISTCNNENNKLEEKATRYIEGMFGQKESKTSTDEIAKARKTFMEQNTCELIDPIDCKDVSDKLQEEIAAFKSEVDSALSVSNALTVIEIDY